MKRVRLLAIAMGMVSSLIVPTHVAWAGDYPDRPIKLISPYAAGGLTDILARMIAKRLSERVAQPVIVDNRTGAGGILGVDAAAKAPPDGYTIVLVGQGLASVNASLHKKLPYDTLRDFAPITLIASFPLVLVAHPTASPKTVAEFIAAARAKPGMLTYGSAGNASTAHLASELFREQVGIQINHIPYKGEAPAFTDVISGNVNVMFATLGGALPFIESGRMRPLAIATKERSKLLPTVPTMSEAGVPGFEVMGWYGVLVPKNTPQAVIDRLSKEFMAMAREPELRDQLAARGLDAIGSPAETLGKLIESETHRWRTVVTKSGIQAD